MLLDKKSKQILIFDCNQRQESVAIMAELRFHSPYNTARNAAFPYIQSSVYLYAHLINL